MRLGTLSIIASSLLAISSLALAQTESDEIPEPPAPSHPLPPVTSRSARLPANHLPPWQTLSSGYGGYYGAWNDYGYGGGHCGGCESCGTCCRACRPGLMFRIKSLKCKLCAAWACRQSCRQSCRSCCSSCSSCSSCCGGDLQSYEAPTAAGPSDLPTPPPEPTPYDGDADEMTEEPASQGAALSPAIKRQYTMPRVTSSRKSVTKSKSRR
ncbi:MAG TPA: hypothetical protein VNH11_26395 [Pirellulales bacterium]|nr:hypothetical protein [Pirellulales bacterium]